MKRAYDVIVVGCGGIGGAAAYWLGRELHSDVLALEQFRLGHDHGASQDHSRIIRLCYHLPEYTALTPHTYTAWAEVEAESGVQLVVKTGGLDISAAGSDTYDLYAGAMRAAAIPFEELSAADVMAAYPQWRLDGDERALYQADSGLVDARKANATHIALARASGATILDETPVHSVRATPDGVEVDTPAGTFGARRLVVAADAWTNHVLGSLGIQWPLTVTQEQVTYYATPHLRQFAPDRFPIWIWHGADILYGFPIYGEIATKAGVDVGGETVTHDTRTFEPNPRAHQRLHGFLERHIPDSVGPILYTKTCLYTMPPDRNFVIDTLAEAGYPQIIVAQGAGHAFKFASLLGQILRDLALRGETTFPISPFTASRPAITDPSYPPSFTM